MMRRSASSAQVEEASLDNAALHNAAVHSAAVSKTAAPPSRNRAVEMSANLSETMRLPRVSVVSTKGFPETAHLRRQLSASAERHSLGLRAGDACTKQQLERLARAVLAECHQSEKLLGYVMVLLGNIARRDQFVAVPFSRRLLLLPGGHAETLGPLAPFVQRATRLGYQVLSAEATPEVLMRILEGRVDAILGLATLDDLERAFDHSVLSGLPAFAVPLPYEISSSDEVDGPWVADVLSTHVGVAQAHTDSYLLAMRAAARLFRDDFARLLPRIHSATPDAARSPLGLTEDIAYDWLANGGKRFRPFITLAAFDAASRNQHGKPQLTDGQPFSDSVCRVAMAIEAFHKASLVHDDIQDDDLFRYGRDTLHRSQGLGPAINIGDYLIGLGYRLINSCRHDLGAEIACDITDNMALAHLHLCDGQGAEMAWRDHPDWSLAAADAVEMYALKTSPAFEAALYAGLRMAGPAEDYQATVTEFCRELGVGFQIVNDLQDWVGDTHNKLVAGQDALALRPTVLLALALEAASDLQRGEIREIFEATSDDAQRLERLRELFAELGTFAAARGMVESSRARSQALADSVQPPRLQSLFQFLLETVLPADKLPPEPQPAPRAAQPARASI